jgi:hypothetical protein
MNGRVAKKIRKRIFGDDATMGKRQEYQDAKKDYIKEKTP